MGRWSGRVMGQKGFFDVERRLAAISSKGDPLEAIKKIVRWEDFRADIEAMTQTEPEERKSNAGRKPYDALLKFKIVVLQSLHNLSDKQTEYLIRDRFSFMRFLDLEIEDPVPDATTIWLFREALMECGLIDRLFARFGQHLEAAGYIARGGQIIDATIVSVPKQRNTKEENEAIKAGKTPEGWEQRPAKNAQKDKDARWTKKNDESFYGYKNHVDVDKAHNLIRKWDVTNAAVHVRSWTTCSISPTPARRCGRTALTDRWRPRRACRRRACRAVSTGVPLAIVRCQSARRRRTRRARGCAPVSSMYSATSRARWAARSCAPSASPGRGSRSG